MGRPQGRAVSARRWLRVGSGKLGGGVERRARGRGLAGLSVWPRTVQARWSRGRRNGSGSGSSGALAPKLTRLVPLQIAPVLVLIVSLVHI